MQLKRRTTRAGIAREINTRGLHSIMRAWREQGRGDSSDISAKENDKDGWMYELMSW